MSVEENAVDEPVQGVEDERDDVRDAVEGDEGNPKWES